MSDEATIKFDPASPWGRYAPTGWHGLLVRICQSLPASPRFFYTLNKGIRGPVKSAEPRFFDVDVLGLKLRLLTRGNYCETTALFAPQFYDALEFGWLRGKLTKSSHEQPVFVDIGGNVGLYSLVAAASNPDTRVVTVEPNTELTERLKFNASSNQLVAEVCETALSDYHGTGELTRSAHQSGENQLSTPGAHIQPSIKPSVASENTVEVTTLPELVKSLRLDHIDILKIDIEGHEHRVLKYFFEHANAGLHPASIIIEHVHDAAGTVDMLTTDAGYRVEAKAARNVLLVK